MDFKPQNQIQNLTAEIEKISVKTHSSIKIANYSSAEWREFIDPIKKTIQTNLEAKFFQYTYVSDTNFFQITLNSEEIEVNSESASSPLVSGDWWDVPLEINVEKIEGITQISFRTEYKWPVPFIDGKLDAQSAYSLSKLAESLNNFSAQEFFLQKSALVSQGTKILEPIQEYIQFLLDKDRKTEAVHWFSRLVLENQDDESAYYLSGFLVNGEGVEQNWPLAENLLYNLCRNEFHDAFEKLAILYLNGGAGVQQNKSRAKHLFCLANIYNPSPKYDTLLNSDMFDENEIVTTKKSFSVADILLSAGVVTVGIGLLVFTLKKFFRK